MGKDRREKPIATYQRHERLFRFLFGTFLVVGGLGLLVQGAFAFGFAAKMMDVLASWLIYASLVMGMGLIFGLHRFPRFVLYSDSLHFGPGQWVTLSEVEAVRRAGTGFEIALRRRSPVHLAGPGSDVFVATLAEEASLKITGGA